MHMVGRTMVVLVAVAAFAARAGAFSMGEVAATTGMQGTLASSGTTHPAGTLGSVKNALNAATAKKQGQLNAATGSAAWGGKGGGQSAWASLKGGSSAWASPGGSSGWTGSSGPAGWASASNAAGNAWASGAWGSGSVAR